LASARPARRRDVDEYRLAPDGPSAQARRGQGRGFGRREAPARGATREQRRVPGGGRGPLAQRPPQPRHPRTAVGRRRTRGAGADRGARRDPRPRRARRPAGRLLQRRGGAPARGPPPPPGAPPPPPPPPDPPPAAPPPYSPAPPP